MGKKIVFVGIIGLCMAVGFYTYRISRKVGPVDGRSSSQPVSGELARPKPLADKPSASGSSVLTPTQTTASDARDISLPLTSKPVSPVPEADRADDDKSKEKLLAKIAEWKAKYPQLFVAYPKLEERLAFGDVDGNWSNTHSPHLSGWIEIITYLEGRGRSHRYSTKWDKNTMVINELLKFLTHPEPEMRRGAIHMLANVQANDATQPVLNLLSDPDATVRSAVVYFIGQLGITEVANYVIMLLSDPAPEVREASIYVLGSFNAKEMVPTIIRLASEDKDINVRLSAMRTLGKLQATEAVPVLMRLLSDDTGWIRGLSVLILADLKAVESIPSIIPLLSDADKIVRSDAMSALGQLRVKEAIPKITVLLSDSESQVRIEAIRILKDLQGKEAIPSLTELLFDPDMPVRRAAQEAIKALEDK